jgi:phage I-like protein
MPIEFPEKNKMLMGVIFPKPKFQDFSQVEMWLMGAGYDLNTVKIESSKDNFRALFTSDDLKEIDQMTMIKEPQEDGVIYIVGFKHSALQFANHDFFNDNFKFEQEQENTFKILYTGKFNHMGSDFEITPETLEQMLINFKQNVLKKDLPVDFSHKDHEKAAGWIKDLTLDDKKEALFATVKWTPSGAQALSGKEFRYFSADFFMSYTDNETGESVGPLLRGGALTNIPFLKLDPIVALSLKPHEKEENNKEKEKMAEKSISLSEHQEAIQAKDERISKLEEDNVKLAEVVKKVDELEKVNKTLLEENEEFKEKIKLAEKEKAFDKLLADEKACEAQRESYLKGDMIAFAQAAQPVNLANKGSSKSPGEGDSSYQLSDEEKNMLKKYMPEMTEEEFKKANNLQ